MAPLPTIPNTYRVALSWFHTDLKTAAANVMHFRKSGSNPAALWTALDSHVTSTMWNLTDSHGSIAEVTITPLDGSSVSLPEPTGSPAKWSGGTTGSHNPVPNVAAIVKFVTGKRGRSYRGRIYLPWIEEAYIDGLTLDNSQRTAVQTAWATFLTAMTGDGFDLVVASYKLSTAETVLASGVENDIATQRRRAKRTSLAS